MKRLIPLVLSLLVLFLLISCGDKKEETKTEAVIGTTAEELVIFDETESEVESETGEIITEEGFPDIPVNTEQTNGEAEPKTEESSVPSSTTKQKEEGTEKTSITTKKTTTTTTTTTKKTTTTTKKTTTTTAKNTTTTKTPENTTKKPTTTTVDNGFNLLPGYTGGEIPETPPIPLN